MSELGGPRLLARPSHVEMQGQLNALVDSIVQAAGGIFGVAERPELLMSVAVDERSRAPAADATMQARAFKDIVSDRIHLI